jgi:hypothetical protein
MPRATPAALLTAPATVTIVGNRSAPVRLRAVPRSRAAVDAIAGTALVEAVSLLTAWLRGACDAESTLREVAHRAAAAVAELDRHASRRP